MLDLGYSPREIGLRLRLNGYTVDFYWPGFRLVVETDGRATTAPRPPRRATPGATGSTL